MANPVAADHNLPILEGLIAAIILAANDHVTAGDGLGDSDIAAITSPGTVEKLYTAVSGLTHYERDRAQFDAILSAIELGANPIYPISFAITSATPAASGGSLADATYYVRATALDRFGKESAVSAELSAVVTGGGGSGKVTVILPVTPGAVSFRVYVGTAAGVETVYKASAANAGISSSTTTVVVTSMSSGVVTATPPAAGTVSAGYGFLTDIIVETARAAGTYASLYNALVAQHPLGSAVSSNVYTGAMAGGFAYNTSTFAQP